MDGLRDGELSARGACRRHRGSAVGRRQARSSAGRSRRVMPDQRDLRRGLPSHSDIW